jgi:hypothetical protein
MVVVFVRVIVMVKEEEVEGLRFCGSGLRFQLRFCGSGLRFQLRFCGSGCEIVRTGYRSGSDDFYYYLRFGCVI